METGHEYSDQLATDCEFNQPKRLPCPIEDSHLTSQRLPLNPKAPEWQNKTPQYSPFNAVAKSMPQTTQALPVGHDIQLLLRQQPEASYAFNASSSQCFCLHQRSSGPEYCDFIQTFQDFIERKTSSPSTTPYYLLQYTSGQVQDLEQSCLAMQEDSGYKEPRKLLAEMYGQSYKIASSVHLPRYQWPANLH